MADGSLLLKRTDTSALALTARPANAAVNASRLKANDTFISVLLLRTAAL
ncbi:MAG TPA: hypothetical protein VFK10_01500 [Burkholderiaceae bacterium]|nr:hypothetical protein [Burkholderiaceae bacterium]